MATENKKYIPALRFPEFQNDREWKIVLLKDFTERIKSKVGKNVVAAQRVFYFTLL